MVPVTFFSLERKTQTALTVMMLDGSVDGDGVMDEKREKKKTRRGETAKKFVIEETNEIRRHFRSQDLVIVQVQKNALCPVAPSSTLTPRLCFKTTSLTASTVHACEGTFMYTDRIFDLH